MLEMLTIIEIKLEISVNSFNSLKLEIPTDIFVQNCLVNSLIIKFEFYLFFISHNMVIKGQSDRTLHTL